MLKVMNGRRILALVAVLSLAVTAACEADADGQPSAEPASTPAVVSGDPAGPDGTTPVGDDVAADVNIEAAAREFLEGEIGEGDFNLRSSEPVGWSDASLGCPQEGFAYAQVLTPGHKLVFELDGTLYPVHSNADGSHMVICGFEE